MVEKHYPSSFAGTDLHAYLQEKGAKKLVLTGYMVRSFSLFLFLFLFLSLSLSLPRLLSRSSRSVGATPRPPLLSYKGPWPLLAAPPSSSPARPPSRSCAMAGCRASPRALDSTMLVSSVADLWMGEV